MLHLVYHQRHRLLIAGALGGLAGLGLAGAELAAAMIAGCAILTAAVVLAVAPDRRGCIETGLAGLALATLLPQPLLVPGTLLFAGLVHQLIHGPILDGVGPRLSLQSDRTVRVPLPVEAVWKAVVPGAGPAETHWTGAMLDHAADPDDIDTLYMRFAMPDGLFDEMTATLIERRPHRRASFLLERDDVTAPEAALFEYDLQRTDGGDTLLHSRMVMDGLSPRRAFTMWCDDSYGDEMDGFARTLRKKRCWSRSAADPQPDALTA